MSKMKLLTFLGLAMFLGTFSSNDDFVKKTPKKREKIIINQVKILDSNYYLRQIENKYKNIYRISDSVTIQQKIMTNDKGNNIANF